MPEDEGLAPLIVDEVFRFITASQLNFGFGHIEAIVTKRMNAKGELVDVPVIIDAGFRPPGASIARMEGLATGRSQLELAVEALEDGFWTSDPRYVLDSRAPEAAGVGVYHLAVFHNGWHFNPEVQEVLNRELNSALETEFGADHPQISVRFNNGPRQGPLPVTDSLFTAGGELMLVVKDADGKKRNQAWILFERGSRNSKCCN